MTVTAVRRPVGELLRTWRQKRRLSQLELSSQAEVSARHLSFVETGRSKPTAEMILKLTEHMDVPLRERNHVLLAGGYAPAYPEHTLDAPELAAVRDALRLVLTGHQPYPALVVNRYWEMLDANSAVVALSTGIAPFLLEPPVNVLRLSLHPEGLAPRIANLAQWRAHLISQVRRRAEHTGDARLAELDRELRSYPGGLDAELTPANAVLPLQLAHPTVGDLSLLSIAAVLETAADITLQELSVESFFPADSTTAQRLHALGEPSRPSSA